MLKGFMTLSVEDRGIRYITLHTPLLKLMHQNFKDKEEGYRARRAYELHDKLSESA